MILSLVKEAVLSRGIRAIPLKISFDSFSGSHSFHAPLLFHLKCADIPLGID